MDYYDISPLISEKTAVFPGDKKFSRDIALDMNKGDHLRLSSISTTLHIGAHADASNHYSKEGGGIAERELNYYLGECQLIKLELASGERVLPEHLKQKIIAPRVLFSTGSFPNPDKWNNDFNSLSPELIFQLADQGVITVGIDTPSVDPWDSKELESHNAIAERNLAILEGLVLSEVPEGVYELIALPLKIEEADASPVRAILRKS